MYTPKLALLVVTGLTLFASSALAEPTKSTQASTMVASRPAATAMNNGLIPAQKEPIKRLPPLSSAQRDLQMAKEDEKRATADTLLAAGNREAAAKDEKAAKEAAAKGNGGAASKDLIDAKHRLHEAAKEQGEANSLRRRAHDLRMAAARDGLNLHRPIKLLHK